ncbi:MAG: hypothetical protein ACK5PP_18690 [Acidimicrobiales bacterium]
MNGAGTAGRRAPTDTVDRGPIGQIGDVAADPTLDQVRHLPRGPTGAGAALGRGGARTGARVRMNQC